MISLVKGKRLKVLDVAVVTSMEVATNEIFFFLRIRFL